MALTLTEKPTEDSDVDFLVVTKAPFSIEKTYKIRRKFLKDFSTAVQIFFVKNEDFLETKDVVGGITYPASKYGKVLYEKP